MAKGNYREFLKGDIVWIKKYFYVLRPLLAIRWFEIHPTRPVPMEFQKLVDACVDSAEVRSAIDELLTLENAPAEELTANPRSKRQPLHRNRTHPPGKDRSPRPQKTKLRKAE